MQTVLCLHCRRTYPVGSLTCPDDGTTLTEAKLQTIGPGLKIGEYIIEKKLGEGGMGEVWSGKHPQIGKLVAVKILSANLVANPETIARFVQEARAVNEIQHRNIVDIFSFGELSDGRPYFVMEYLRGKSLADYLAEKGTLPYSELLTIFDQICSALHACHAQSIIHRDLKPDNIFLVFGGGASRDASSIFVKLLDFGIAKLDSAKGENLTGSGVMMGTPAYMSPEQCEGAKKVDHSSDIYSLGIILFELLTGRTPFREPTDGLGAIISKQMFLPPPAPSSMVSGRKLPFSLDLLVLRILSKSPADRPPSCLALYDDLASVIGDEARETSESIHGARPVYLAATDGLSEPAKKVVTREVVKKSGQTPNAQALQEARDPRAVETRMATPTSSSPRASRRPLLLGVGALLAVGLFAVFASPSSIEGGATKINLGNNNVISLPTNTTAIEEPAPQTTLPSEKIEPAPASQPEPPAKEKPSSSKKKPPKPTKKKDALLLHDDD